MDLYKDYLQLLRTSELEVVYLQILDDLSPEMMNIVKGICNVKFCVFDGDLHTYYGDMKTLVTAFITFWNEKMDESIKEADRYCGTITKDNLLGIIEKTLNIHRGKHILFGKEYLPITQLEQRNIYENLEIKYRDYIEKLQEIKDKVELFDKPKLSEDFIKENMEISKVKTYDIFVVTHKYIAQILADHQLPKIRSSLEDIITRVRTNLRRLQTETDGILNDLVNELYDHNKEHLRIFRQDRKSSVALAEVSKAIDNIRDRIEDFSTAETIEHLETELFYWEEKKAELDKASALIEKIKSELNCTMEQEKLYESLNCQETPVPGSKNRCWKITGDNLRQRKKYLKMKLLEASQVLVTHFGTRGPNRKIYADENGKFYIDEYDHQVYLLEHGLKEFHVTCDGTMKQAANNEISNYDHFGRYILNKDDRKIYQRAPCGSSYQLDDNNLMVKSDKDCGHAENINMECKMKMRDPYDAEILPKPEILDIRKSMEPEAVGYLWDAFGPLLHHALYDVAKLKPKNPIHYLAHRILAHKYGRTGEELKNKSIEADEYRDRIYKERKEKAIAANKAWKAKQSKPVKPEDLDDAQLQAALEAQRAANQFTIQLGYFD